MRELDDTLSDADLDGMISEIDGDGSGTVDFDGELMDMPFIAPHTFPSTNSLLITFSVLSAFLEQYD